MFRILGNIDESEWVKLEPAASEHAAGSEFDRNCLAHYRLLYGSIAMQHDNGSLFQQAGSDTISASLLDIGYQLAIVSRDVKTSGEARVSTADDGLEIYLKFDGRMLTLATNYFEPKLVVSIEDFERGCDRLLSDLAGCLRNRVPEILRWHSVAPITAYAPS